MGAGVDQNATACGLAMEERVRYRRPTIYFSLENSERTKAPQTFISDPVAYHFSRRKEPTKVTHRKFSLYKFCSLYHGVAIADGACHWLFTEYVRTRFQRVDSHRQMQVVR